MVFALLWGLVPMVFLSIAAADGAKTLIARYFLVALPGWAVVAGVGVSVLSRGVAAAVRNRWAGWVVGAGVPIVVLALLGASQQQAIRTADGHQGGDARPTVALLHSTTNLPAAVVVPDLVSMPPLQAYYPGIVRRMPLYRSPNRQGALILVRSKSPAAIGRLASFDRVIVVVQGNAAVAQLSAERAPGLEHHRLIQLWSRSGWSVAVLQRG